MRLTKAMKEEIVSSILRDVPKVDHTDKIEMLAKNLCFKKLPTFPLTDMLTKAGWTPK